ncbi:hypothetical protein I4U23_031518 [Adineta vaga]|nr:hypothetical protein I4U23_031518 [Adineta vaga]
MEEYCSEARAENELGETYVKNIRAKLQKAKEKYSGYKQKTVATVESLKSISFSLKSYEKNDFGLVWMTPAPRIGIYSQQPQRLRSLYNFMLDVNEKMEKDLSQKDQSFKNFGCHFCLFVSARSQESTTIRQCDVLNETGEGVKTQELVGYIQMDDQQYYRLLPNENYRRLWFDGFKRHDFLVIT